jgi:hypothetical protein
MDHSLEDSMLDIGRIGIAWPALICVTLLISCAEEVPRPPYEFTEADQAALQRARDRIPQLRHGAAALTLTDAEGKPMPAGSTVEYRLARHAFILGSPDRPDPRPDRLRSRLHHNARTIMAAWTRIQADGSKDYDFRRTEYRYSVSWHRQLGDALLFQNVLWLIHGKDNNGVMEGWIPRHAYELKDQAFEAQRKEILRHVEAVARHTRGTYEIVNLWNEPLNAWANWFEWNEREFRTILVDSAERFKEHNPSSEVMVNLGAALWETGQHMSVDEFVEWVSSEEVKVDRVGLQLWANGELPWGAKMSEHLTLEKMEEDLRELGRHGVPLDITEFAAPVKGGIRPGWEWNEARQADFAEAALTIAFGSEGVASFFYFSAYDRFMKYSGLLDDDGRPREVAVRLEKLIDSWTTAGAGQTNAEGRLTVEGVGGLYRAIVRPPGIAPLHYEFAIKPRERVELTLPPVPAPPARPADPRYAELSGWITADMVLDGRLEPRTPDQAPPAGRRPAELRIEAIDRERHTGLPDTLVANPDGSFSTNEERGFAISGLPESSHIVTCDLEVLAAPGLDAIQVFSGTMRFVHEEVPAGEYRLTFPTYGADQAFIRFTPRRTSDQTGEIRMQPPVVGPDRARQ